VKGDRTKKKTTVINQIKGHKAPDSNIPAFAKAKKGESGRMGGGRFNREVAFERNEQS